MTGIEARAKLESTQNPMRLHRSAIAILLAVLVVTAMSAQPARHEPAAPSAAKLYRIAGTVTNSITGEPVAGASVNLSGDQPRVLIQTVEADAEGRFQLHPVAAGKYSLLATRRGYMGSAFNQHEQYSSAIVTGEGQDTEHIPFHLDPGAVIRGLVTDDTGEPVANAKVLLMHSTRDGGLGQHLNKSISGETDDTGLFEFWNLRPGTYFLAVKANPWFALHPSAAGRSEAAAEPGVDTTAALDVAYPVTYYDSATDEASAAPIQIGVGERVRADMSLHAVPALRLTFPGSGAAREETDSPDRRVFLKQTVFGDPDFGDGRIGFPSGPSQPVEFAGIAPGHYTLVQGIPPRISGIDANGSQELDPSAGLPTFPVDVKARMADQSAPPPGLEIVLVSDDERQQEIKTQLDKLEGKIESVPPGRWNVLAQAKDTVLSVVSLQSGAAALSDGRIVLKDRPVSLSVTISAGKTDIEGFAKKEGKGQAGVMIVLVPRAPSTSLTRYRRDQSDSDGSFLLKNVAPGNYTAVAIEDGWGLDWARPEVIRTYLAAGTAITVSPAAGDHMQLDTPLQVQPR